MSAREKETDNNKRVSIKQGLASCMDIYQKWKIKNLSIYNTSMLMCEFLLTDLTCTVLLPYSYWFIFTSIKFRDSQFNTRKQKIVQNLNT